MNDGPITVKERAYDDERPPSLELIDDCVHCGFCLPTCPTYVLWGEEMDSPRGRIVLMKEGHVEGSELSGELVNHIDNCLGCMACVTACPSGVQYDKLIEDTRGQVERNHARSPGDRAFRRLIFELFPHPGRLRALAPGLAAARRLGLDRLAARPRLRALAPRMASLASLAPGTSVRSMLSQSPQRFPALGESRGQVGLLPGCVQRVFFGDVNEATARVLAAEGFDVTMPRQPRCCGALQLHCGEDSTHLARATIAAFEDFEHVVVNAAGCGSALKDYAHVLREDPEWSERAERFCSKVRDANELLADVEPRATRAPVAMKVAYHDACHLAHAQGIRAQPRDLLAAIPELELVEPDGWEICCGSAGVYNLLEPDPAAALGRRKARNLLDTGAEAVASANPGCTLQIALHTERLGRRLPVLHPMQLLQMSIEGS
jgi:glycolate oxidase iron-sulfur subunit